MNGDKHIVYTLHGDGELQEGQIWEAALFGAQHKIDNLIATVDYNKVQIDGPTSEVMNMESLEDKWKAFGWKVLTTDGGNMEVLVNTLAEAKAETGKGQPIVILMSTEMGQGVDFMMGSHKWHGVAPNDEQLADALSQLDSTLQDY